MTAQDEKIAAHLAAHEKRHQRRRKTRIANTERKKRAGLQAFVNQLKQSQTAPTREEDR